MTMMNDFTISASEFKAKCLEMLDALAHHKVARISVTKRGKIVAVLTPPPLADTDALFGCMRGCVIAPEGFDFTAPAMDESLDAEKGILHR